MKLSFFRSRSDVSSPKKEKKFRRMLSPGRSKSLTPHDIDKLSSSPPTHAAVSVSSKSASSLSGIVNSIDDPASSDLLSSSSEQDNTSPPAHNISTTPLASDGSAIDERDMHRKLMDVESSFLPDRSTGQTSRRSHSAGNWAVFGSPTQSRFGADVLVKGSDDLVESDVASSNGLTNLNHASQGFIDPPNATPSIGINAYANEKYPESTRNSHEFVHEEIPSTSRDDLESSPAAAAAKRSQSRAFSMLDGNVVSSRALGVPGTPTSERSNSMLDDETPKQLRRIPSQVENRSLQPPVSPPPKKYRLAAPASTSLDDVQDRAAPLPMHPPLHSGHTRQMSSVSSMANRSEMSTEAPSEDTIGADYALHTGGTVPPNSSALQSSREISRVPSFGSIASSVSAHTEATSRKLHKRGLSDLLRTPIEKNLVSVSEESKSQISPSTPNHTEADPSDTVLAKHVREIEVPDTVARDFRDTYKETDDKSTMSTPFIGRAKNGLTLKEQNNKVDKLSKENFDLKLKIHFLHQALQVRSDEGVKDLISKNAQIQADLVRLKKENAILRRKLRDFEREQAIRNDGLSVPGQSIQDESEDDVSSRGFRHGQMEEEIMYLRDRVQFLVEDNAKFREETIARETEKRRMLDPSNILNNRPNSEGLDKMDEIVIWKEALQDETAKRQRIEREADALRLEVIRLRKDDSSLRELRLQPSRGTLGSRDQASPVRSHFKDPYDSQSLSGTTLVEQLKHENAELRRDLGAQTSMLTSRNRERERLQQEIENLKLFQRRGDGITSAAGDSILERSVSQAYHRPTSRISGAARETNPNDLDREQLERRYANLRDDNATLRLRNQDLQRDLDTMGNGVDDMQALQVERDDAIRLLEETEGQWDVFRQDAMNTINGLEELIEEREQDITNLAGELEGREDEINALRQEIKAVSESLVRLADDREASQNQIQNLEQDLTNANGELEALEKGLRELSAAKERLEVQAESSQSEIAFLREEQEGDKMKIGDLESALRSAKSNLKDGEEKSKEMEEMQVNLSKSKEAIRQLKTSLSLKEVESNNVKDRLEELENGLRATIGDFQGPRSSLLREIMKRQRDLENTIRELDVIKYDLGEKQRLLKDRENLLEASGLENRRLSDELDRERTTRKQVQESHERALRNNDPVARITELDIARTQDRKKLAALEQRYTEQLRERNTLLISLWTRLSSLCGTDWSNRHDGPKNQSAAVESVTTDLSTFNKSILHALNNVEAIIQSFPSRIRTTEKSLLTEFATLEEALAVRTKRIEKLEMAIANSDNNNFSSDSNLATLSHLKSLKDENRSLRREIKHFKQGTWFALPGLPTPDIDSASSDRHHSSRATQKERSRDRRSELSPSPSGNTTASTAIHPHLLAPQGRHYSSSALESKTSAAASAAAIALQQQKQAAAAKQAQQISVPSGRGEDSGSTIKTLDAITTAGPDVENARLMLQLKEMQKRLKAEREARLADRSGARKRLEEGKAENDGLRRELERIKLSGSGDDSAAEAEPTAGEKKQ